MVVETQLIMVQVLVEVQVVLENQNLVTQDLGLNRLWQSQVVAQVYL